MEFLRDGEDLVFLYQLIEGATDSSYACHIAAQADLPPEIVCRGKEVSYLGGKFMISLYIILYSHTAQLIVLTAS